MRQLLLRISLLVPGLLLAGCADRCFYQVGKSIEQCQQDLLECTYSNSDLDICMRGKGYGYSDGTKPARSGKRKKVTARFEEYTASGDHRVVSKTYWVMDGFGAFPLGGRVFSEQGAQILDPNSSAEKLIGYKARKDDSDRFIFIPVYENQ